MPLPTLSQRSVPRRHHPPVQRHRQPNQRRSQPRLHHRLSPADIQANRISATTRSPIHSRRRYPPESHSNSLRLRRLLLCLRGAPPCSRTWMFDGTRPRPIFLTFPTFPSAGPIPRIRASFQTMASQHGNCPRLITQRLCLPFPQAGERPRLRRLPNMQSLNIRPAPDR